jgi:hypothetical protein
VYCRLHWQVFVCDRYGKSDRGTTSLEIDLCDDRVAVWMHDLTNVINYVAGVERC